MHEHPSTHGMMAIKERASVPPPPLARGCRSFLFLPCLESPQRLLLQETVLVARNAAERGAPRSHRGPSHHGPSHHSPSHQSHAPQHSHRKPRAGAASTSGDGRSSGGGGNDGGLAGLGGFFSPAAWSQSDLGAEETKDGRRDDALGGHGEIHDVEDGAWAGEEGWAIKVSTGLSTGLNSGLNSGLALPRTLGTSLEGILADLGQATTSPTATTSAGNSGGGGSSSSGGGGGSGEKKKKSKPGSPPPSARAAPATQTGNYASPTEKFLKVATRQSRDEQLREIIARRKGNDEDEDDSHLNSAVAARIEAGRRMLATRSLTRNAAGNSPQHHTGGGGGGGGSTSSSAVGAQSVPRTPSTAPGSATTATTTRGFGVPERGKLTGRLYPEAKTKAWAVSSPNDRHNLGHAPPAKSPAAFVTASPGSHARSLAALPEASSRGSPASSGPFARRSMDAKAPKTSKVKSMTRSGDAARGSRSEPAARAGAAAGTAGPQFLTVLKRTPSHAPGRAQGRAPHAPGHSGGDRQAQGRFVLDPEVDADEFVMRFVGTSL